MSGAGWELVGGDPAPGDPECHARLAASFDRTAKDALDSYEALTGLTQAADDSIWRGPAAESFRDNLQKKLAPRLRKLHDSYATASKALGGYAATLGELKREAAVIVGDATLAQGEVVAREQARDQALAADPVALTAADGAVQEARNRLRRSQAQIEQIRERHRAAEHKAVAALGRASEQGIQNERFSGLKNVLRAIGDAFDRVGIALLVVAAVVVVAVLLTNPAGWAALAAALAAAGPILQAASVVGGIAFATRLARLGLGDSSLSMRGVALEAGLIVAGPLAGRLRGFAGSRLSTLLERHGAKLTDRNGYRVAQRDLDFVGINTRQLFNMLERRAPLGVTPQQWDEMTTELADVLKRSGLEDADVRLHGTAANFFSGNPQKTFPQSLDELKAKTPKKVLDEAVRRYEASPYAAGGGEGPASHFFDSRYQFGLDEMSDLDFQISSKTLDQRMEEFRARNPSLDPFSDKGGVWKPRVVAEQFPELSDFTQKWRNQLDGRPVNLAGLPREELAGRAKAEDWVIIDRLEERGS